MISLLTITWFVLIIIFSFDLLKIVLTVVVYNSLFSGMMVPLFSLHTIDALPNDSNNIEL